MSNLGDPFDIQGALRYIAGLGGNLSDERHTEESGPRDAVARGLMYTEARRVARAVLAGEDWKDDKNGRST